MMKRKVKLTLKAFHETLCSKYGYSRRINLFYGGECIERIDNRYYLFSMGGSVNGQILAFDEQECTIGTDDMLFLPTGKYLMLSKQERELMCVPVEPVKETVEATQSDLISRNALIQSREEDDALNYSDNHDANARDKAIDEFAKRLHELCGMEIGDCQYPDVLHEGRIDEVAKELKDSAPQIAQDAGEEMFSVKVPKSLLESEGETVYYIMDGEICECDLCSIVIDTKGVWAELLSDEYIFPFRNPDPELDDDPQDWCEKGTLVSVEEWGKSLFPTRERAEIYLEQEDERER